MAICPLSFFLDYAKQYRRRWLRSLFGATPVPEPNPQVSTVASLLRAHLSEPQSEITFASGATFDRLRMPALTPRPPVSSRRPGLRLP